jgi:hypothetical protein
VAAGFESATSDGRVALRAEEGAFSSSSMLASESGRLADALAFDALVLAKRLRADMLEELLMVYKDQV